MPIFNTRKKARKQAEELAKKYNIRYSEDGGTFTIFNEDNDRGRTDLMVDADRWLPTLSRKKRLTTKYFEKLAKKYTPKNSVTNSNVVDNSTNVNSSTNTNSSDNKETVQKSNQKNKIIETNNNSNSNTKSKTKQKNNSLKLVQKGEWSHAGDTKRKRTNKSNNTLHWNTELLNPTSDITSTPNNSLHWNTENIENVNDVDLATTNDFNWVLPVNTLSIDEKKEALPFFIPQEAMKSFTRGKDGKYKISVDELKNIGLDNTIKIKDIKAYESVDEAFKNFNLDDNWDSRISSPIIFRVKNKYYTIDKINNTNKATEFDPVIVTVPSVLGGNPDNTGRLLINNVSDVYSKIRELENHKQRLKPHNQYTSNVNKKPNIRELYIGY